MKTPPFGTGTVRVVTFATEAEARQFDRAKAVHVSLTGTADLVAINVEAVELDPREKVSLRRWAMENGNPYAAPAMAGIPDHVLRQVRRRGKWTEQFRKEGGLSV